MSNTTEELHATITARAELDRAFARLLVEESATVMSRNVVSLLNTHQRDIELERAAIQTIVKEAITQALQPVMAEFRDASDERDAMKAEFSARLDRKRERLDAHEQRIARLEQVAAEHQARMDARPSPEKAHATYDGVQRILEHLGLADDGPE